MLSNEWILNNKISGIKLVFSLYATVCLNQDNFCLLSKDNSSYPLSNSTHLHIVASLYTSVSRSPDFDVIFRFEARGIRRRCVWRLRNTVKESAQLSGFSMSKRYVTVECRTISRVFPWTIAWKFKGYTIKYICLLFSIYRCTIQS